jgi:tRNA threonylcarbamoyladenosine biosynthesis protein TsaB
MIMPANPSIRILALDTSTPRGSVALLEGEVVVAELRLKSLETHSARLLRSIGFLLESAGWSLNEVDLVAAGIGPGSFTGIRIGVATALGLAQSLSVPFAGISGLDALANQVSFLEGDIGVVMDAQRSQVYYGEYISRHGRVRRTGKPELWNPSDLESRLRKRHLYVVGESELRLLADLIKDGNGWPRPVAADLFLAAGIGKLALSRKQSWKAGDYLSAEPLYIRPPDALRPKDRK